MDYLTNSVAVPSVAIVVLTWNQRDLTLECLSSLGQLDYPTEKLHIIAVDNGSTDGTIEALRNISPIPFIVENGDNLGFADGNNSGIRLAQELDADYVMLLNNDTVVDINMIQQLVDVGEANEDIGIVTPKIYYYDRPDVIWCAGASIEWQSGRTTRLQADCQDKEADQSIRDVDFASGCAICLKKEVIESIGLLDSRYFIYYEETDWCVRANARGWRVAYVPEAHIWHKVSATMGTTSPATDYYMNRNVMLFLNKNHPNRLKKWISLTRTIARNLITILAYTVKPKRGTRRRNRDAKILALRDSVQGRWGKMPPDVDSICYQNSQ